MLFAVEEEEEEEACPYVCRASEMLENRRKFVEFAMR